MSLDSLLLVIETRHSLKTVYMVGGRDQHSSRFADAFLRVISRNAAIQVIGVVGVRTTIHSLSSLLRSTQSILDCTNADCILETSTGQGAEVFANAFRGNETIQSLHLRRVDKSYLVPILRQPRSCPKLQEISMSEFNQSNTIANAIQHLLGSPSTPPLVIARVRIESEFLQGGSAGAC